MLIDIEKYFLLFMIYSFLGWIMETTLVSIENKRFINRGFLLGPYCPIYGLGAILITLVLGKYKYDPLVLFVMTSVTCGLLEYLTSWAMEKIFKARWWDYSNRMFNLNGRICLSNVIAFGILGLVITYIINPFIIKYVEMLNLETIKWLSIIIGLIFIIDNIISFIVIFSFRKITKTVNKERKEDNTEQITGMVRKLFAEKSFLNRRFINAYPKLIAIKIKVKEIGNKIKENVNEVKDNITEKTNEIKDNIKENISKGTRIIKISLKRTTETAKTKVYLSKKKLFSKFKKKGRK